MPVLAIGMSVPDMKAAVIGSDSNMQARFVIGGRDVTYTIQAGSGTNPFLLPALSGFSCPKAF